DQVFAYEHVQAALSDEVLPLFAPSTPTPRAAPAPEPAADGVVYLGPNMDEVEAFLGADVEWRHGELLTPTRRGVVTARPGDRVARGGAGGIVVRKANGG